MGYNETLQVKRTIIMKNKIFGIILTPVYVPLMAIQLHNAGRPSAFKKDQARRQKDIDKVNATRH